MYFLCLIRVVIQLSGLVIFLLKYFYIINVECPCKKKSFQQKMNLSMVFLRIVILDTLNV